MKKTKFSKLFLFFYLLSSLSFSAENEIGTDKVAHFGISYAIQTASYGIIKQNFNIKKPYALLASFVFTVLVTTAKEMSDPHFDKKDVFANVLGATAASASIVLFDF